MNNDVAPPRNLAELFLGFLSIGARSFGGVMPWAYRVMVEERRWISPADFTETVGLCQFLPGPNIGNTSVVLGKRWFGWRGSIVGFLGLVAVLLGQFMLVLDATVVNVALPAMQHDLSIGPAQLTWITSAHGCFGSHVSVVFAGTFHATTPAPITNGTLAPSSVRASEVSPSLALRVTR